MSEKEKGQDKRYAIFVPLSAQETEGGLSMDWISLASDKETSERAIIEFVDKSGASSWSCQDIKPDGTPVGRRHFYFSEATWKAPYQPTGPRPSYLEKANSSEAIN
jgi:hypothetical protein